MFAIPGDIRTRTGGYIYERRLLEGLRACALAVDHLELPASFPDPAPEDMARALALLSEVPADVPILLDGFLSGTLDTAGLANLAAPLAAVVHHPLGLESALSPERARFLLEREAANLRRIRRIVVPSPHTAHVLATRFGVAPGRITVALPGFDRVEAALTPAVPPLILSVGILHPRKGHDVLLGALADLADLDWQAVIVGKPVDPNHARALRERAASPGLGGRVRIAGEIDDATLQNLYRTATVFALATRYEGYGMVLGEALRHGLPIVSCRAGAVPDTVPQGAGILVPPSDPAAFAQALRSVLTDETLRRSLAVASSEAGRTLPEWSDTAALVARSLAPLFP